MFDTLSEKMTDAIALLRGKSTLTEENIEESLKQVRLALLAADVNFKIVKDFIQAVKEKAVGIKTIRGVDPGDQFVKIVQDELTKIMGEKQIDPFTNDQDVFMIVGLNGAGKTTFCAKLAHFAKSKKNKDVLLVPVDTFRPAAKDQLAIHAKNLNIELYDSDLSKTPAEIALSALHYADRMKKNCIILDMAGRLHVDEELMEELSCARKAINFKSPRPILVADAMTGQEAVNVAQSFHDRIELFGAVLSKMDSDARGGAALSIRAITGVPLLFMSVGEKFKDLDPFYPDRLASRILDMGDVVSLVEKAEEIIDEKEAEKMMKKLEKNQLSIDDFIKQMDMISSMGPLSGLLKMLPGMGGLMKQVGDIGQAENEMKKIKVMASSMTRQEKDNDKILNSSRIARIAKGSGVKIEEVEQFLERFRGMRQMMGSLLSGAGTGGLFDMFGGAGGGGMPNMGGHRQLPQQGKKKGKGKGTGPWGKRYF